MLESMPPAIPDGQIDEHDMRDRRPVKIPVMEIDEPGGETAVKLCPRVTTTPSGA